MKDFQPPTGWFRKFQHAFRGLAQGIQGQNSWRVHIPVAVAVIIAAAWLQVSNVEWSILILCIALVSSMELINSSIEWMAREITQDYRVAIEKALNIASAAVLITAIGSAAVGVLILGPHLWIAMGW